MEEMLQNTHWGFYLTKAVEVYGENTLFVIVHKYIQKSCYKYLNGDLFLSDIKLLSAVSLVTKACQIRQLCMFDLADLAKVGPLFGCLPNPKGFGIKLRNCK